MNKFCKQVAGMVEGGQINHMQRLLGQMDTQGTNSLVGRRIIRNITRNIMMNIMSGFQTDSVTWETIRGGISPPSPPFPPSRK